MNEFSCARHRQNEDSYAWQQSLKAIARVASSGPCQALTPCPWCLDKLLKDLKESHELMDSLGISRTIKGKVTNSLAGRLKILLNKEESIPELRVS